MVRSLRLLAACVAVALVGCASGGDDGNYVGPAGDGAAADDAATVVEGSAERGADSSSPGLDSGGAPAMDSTAGDDGSTAMADDAASDDTGTVVDDAESPDPDSGAVGDVCPDTTKYALEAVAAAAGGNATLCIVTPTSCPSTDCCYQKASPASICVAK